VSQNGSRSLTTIGLGFDVLFAGLGTIYVEGHCNAKPEDCNRGLGYGLLAPVALSLAWGIYRVITIRPEIATGGSVSSSVHRGDVTRQPCPTGTVITLSSEGGSFAGHIDQDGRMASGQLPELVAYLGLPGVITVADPEIKADLSGAMAFLEAQALPAPPP
jgi:hypothetical protein